MYPQCFSQQILMEKLWDTHHLCKDSIRPAHHKSQGVHQLRGKAFSFCVHWSIMNAFSTELLCNSLILIQKTFLPKYSDSCLHAKLLQLCLTLWGLWTVARHWSGLPCPPPEDLPDPGIEPKCLMSPALAGRFLITEPFGKLWEHGSHLISICWINK